MQYALKTAHSIFNATSPTIYHLNQSVPSTAIMSTFFHTAKRNFKDVPVANGKVSTSEFLEASESVVALFGPSSSKSISHPSS